MSESFLAQFQWRCSLLLAGRYDDLARQYRLPLPVTLVGQALNVPTHRALTVHLRQYHEALVRRGVRALRPQVLALDLPLSGSAERCLWVRFREEGGADPQISQAVYRLLPMEGGAMITAVDYTRLAMPEFGWGLVPVLPGPPVRAQARPHLSREDAYTDSRTASIAT